MSKVCVSFPARSIRWYSSASLPLSRRRHIQPRPGWAGRIFFQSRSLWRLSRQRCHRFCFLYVWNPSRRSWCRSNALSPNPSRSAHRRTLGPHTRQAGRRRTPAKREQPSGMPQAVRDTFSFFLPLCVRLVQAVRDCPGRLPIFLSGQGARYAFLFPENGKKKK